MAVNDALFGETARVHTLLKARGFDPKSGSRSGGIRDPRQVTIPPGAILLRTYQDPARLWGEWWFTAFEMAQVIAYFARDGSALAEGRPQGQGVLQATMAVRHEWAAGAETIWRWLPPLKLSDRS
nr:hypothetical protein [uncultured Lichenicoccus sp.]